MHSTKRAAALALVAAFAAACTGGGAATTSPAAPASEAPAASPTAAASEPAAASPSAAACSPDSYELVAPGTLTIGTDNPAYPPYFEIVDAPTDPWELGDPTTGNGFESAFAYALAEELGFGRDQVAWTVVPFNNSFAPGPKEFDLDINQISFTEERAQNVDMSDGYYFVNQAVVARDGSPVTEAASIADLKAFRFGAQVGTTSFETIESTIAPDTETSVYDTNDAAIEALNVGQIDAIVVDLPTAFFITAAQMDDGVIVGQFEAPDDASAEHFSVVLPKDSSLTDCVNEAIAALWSDGRLDEITEEWLSSNADAPVFGP